jgi:hypothetical protein
MTFVMFAVAGPFLMVVLLIVVSKIIGEAPPNQIPPAPFGLAVAQTLLFAYLFGGLQSLAVALVASFFQVRSRSALVPLLPVVVAGVVTGAAFAWLFSTVAVQPLGLNVVLGILGIHVGASLGCWLIANALLWSRYLGSPVDSTP